MAEANFGDPNSTPWLRQVMCRYYLHGICRKGSECSYSHDLSAKTDNVCRYYKNGNCSYGDKCRFDHVKSKDANRGSVRIQNQSESTKPGRISYPQPVQPVVLHAHDYSPTQSKFVTLGKQGISEDSGIGELEEIQPSPSPSYIATSPEHWVKANEFIPGQAWKSSEPTEVKSAWRTPDTIDNVGAGVGKLKLDTADELCPYAAKGECRYGEQCAYMHGEVCDLCGLQVLLPNNPKQRDEHMQECVKQHEEDMELSFAVQRSVDKTCGICMEVIAKKNPTSEARFGILSDCTHVFCLGCIRKWRAAKQFENKIVRACPECRVKSDFVTPSKYWVEDKEEKKKLIEGYKIALSKKSCKYFDEGRGECPFNNNCFYRHAYPDGRVASPKPVRRRKRQNADSDIDLIQQLILWEFIEQRQQLALSNLDWEDVLDELLFNLDSSSDESDFSDVDDYL